MSDNVVTIYFVAPWIRDQRQYLREIAPLTPTTTPQWGCLRVAPSIARAQYVVVLQRETAQSRTIAAKRIIYLQREPEVIQKPEQNRGYCYYGVYTRTYHAAIPWILQPRTRLMQLKPEDEKRRPLVAIVSGKRLTAGHRRRLAIVRALCHHPVVGKLIDVYGHGLDNKLCNGRYRGPVKGKCKFRVLSRYHYALAIENCTRRNYFTEKLVDCYLALTFPLYLGCPNITDYFDDASLHLLRTPYTTTVAARVRATPTSAMYKALRAARDRVLDEYGLWPTLHRIITESAAAVAISHRADPLAPHCAVASSPPALLE